MNDTNDTYMDDSDTAKEHRMNAAVLDADADTQALAITDRCDRCSAQAYVKTTMPSGSELLWCGHHFAGYEASLAASGARVAADSRHTLTP